MPEHAPHGDLDAPSSPDAPEVDPSPTPEEVATNGAAHPTPPSVFDRLRVAQEETRADRRVCLPILPGRFDGKLHVRLKPLEASRRQAKLRQLLKIGGGKLSTEGDLDYQAWVIAAATETILIRPDEGFDFEAVTTGHEKDPEGTAPLGETYAPWVGTEPVRWDGRLMEVLGLSGDPENSSKNVRLIFQNPSAMTELYGLVDAWLKESADFETEDEGDDASVRPT